MFKKIIFSVLFLIFSLISFPKEKKFLVNIENDLWIYKEKENSLYRLTYDKQNISSATWSPDGKYIAYGFARRDYTSDLVILDEAGQEICRMIVSPLKNDNYPDYVRRINKVEWRPDNIIIVKSNVGGPHGAIFDIWQINSSFNCKHIKRINTCWTYECKISPRLEYIICQEYGYDIIIEGQEAKEYRWIILGDLSKKVDPEDTYYDDPEPKIINIDVTDKFCKFEFISDNEVEIFVKNGKEEYYLYKIKEDNLEKIDKLPKEIIKKEIPKELKFKIKGKEYKLYNRSDIFDFYEED